jgi:hypothetical protein
VPRRAQNAQQHRDKLTGNERCLVVALGVSSTQCRVHVLQAEAVEKTKWAHNVHGKW